MENTKRSASERKVSHDNNKQNKGKNRSQSHNQTKGKRYLISWNIDRNQSNEEQIEERYSDEESDLLLGDGVKVVGL